MYIYIIMIQYLSRGVDKICCCAPNPTYLSISGQVAQRTYIGIIDDGVVDGKYVVLSMNILLMRCQMGHHDGFNVLSVCGH